MNSLFDIKDKDIWVIGGAGFLGTAVTKALAQCGARVLCIDIPDRAKELVGREGLHERVTPDNFYASDGDETIAFARKWLARRGTPDGLVNLTNKSFGQPLDALTPAQFEQAARVGLAANFTLAREVGNAMAEKGRGSLVLFSSMYGTVSPDPGMYLPPVHRNPIEYGCIKAGIQQMARYLAVHWGPKNVRCNTISPGPFPSPAARASSEEWMRRLRAHCPTGREGRQEEITGPVIFLLSDASSYVNGHNLAVDGGWTAW